MPVPAFSFRFCYQHHRFVACRFTHVFDEAYSQQKLFCDTALPLVRDLLLFAYPSTAIMAYGVTSAGKTFMMEGSRDAPGLVPQALHLLFSQLLQRKDRWGGRTGSGGGSLAIAPTVHN